MREREREREKVCVRERERERERVCVYEYNSVTDMQVMQRSCASVVAGVHFSLLGRIHVDGFPKATL